eukprot:CAMPEP_0201509658 /NCGR_PEP_ID=MMETSP0161_2-20130828/2648_1 /ASSEMBLY_ACC=CAM_ASM_000251 /TAXON_ID=180227 /ORGANISM="Neoparamoeba aestuarina, Strain SoJaBio B1-5/56/2" /LENGTH=315 /DNA_ID=CAMNT_0047904677 /DNA_START=64 /DNA_END=1011 /DNA_ORIENTATION=-
MEKHSAETSLFQFNALASILSYSFCSGSLLLFNKVVLWYIPCGPFITATQFLFCIVVIFTLHLLKVVQIEEITPDVAKKYGMYVFIFVAGVYVNMQSLKMSNVDVVIVFRAMTPLIVAVCEYLFMGRAFPTMRSLGALLCIVLGTTWYVYCDTDTSMVAYGWVTLYMVLIALEMLWGKKIVGDVKVNLTTSVFCTNLFAFFPMVLLGYLRDDYAEIDPDWFTPNALFLLFVSCAISAGIGYSGWWCRTVVTAAAFTLVGTVNKILTVVLNIAIWDKHASFIGTLGLFACLAGGSFYQQAPMRANRNQLPTSMREK